MKELSDEEIKKIREVHKTYFIHTTEGACCICLLLHAIDSLKEDNKALSSRLSVEATIGNEAKITNLQAEVKRLGNERV